MRKEGKESFGRGSDVYDRVLLPTTLAWRLHNRGGEVRKRGKRGGVYDWTPDNNFEMTCFELWMCC
jgi:hypothetical protein